MNKFIISLAGAATVLVSAIALIDYGNRKAKCKPAPGAELALGLIGAAAGAAIALLAEKELPKHDLLVEDMLDEEELALMQGNIAEVLGYSADHHHEAAAKLRTIEVDEETSIEDFIFNA